MSAAGCRLGAILGAVVLMAMMLADPPSAAAIKREHGAGGSGPKSMDNVQGASPDPMVFRQQLAQGLQYQLKALEQLEAAGPSAAGTAHDMSVAGYKLIRFASNGIEQKMYRDRRKAHDIMLKRAVDRLETARMHNRQAILELKKVAGLEGETVRTTHPGSPKADRSAALAERATAKASATTKKGGTPADTQKVAAGRVAQEDKRLGFALESLGQVVKICREVLTMI